MKTPTLTPLRFANGIWEGILVGSSGPAPAVEAVHLDVTLSGVEVVPLSGTAGGFSVRVPIPASVIGDGVHTLLFRLGGDVLGHVTIVAGVPVEDDLRAEISLLRAELDLLKRAFRRHVAETAVAEQIS